MKSKLLLSVLIFALISFSFTSCKKDEVNPEEKSLIKNIEAIKYMPNASSSSTLDLEYDEKNRLIKIGREEFLYSGNGRVEKKRISDEQDSLLLEYTFHWDSQNRLTEIRLNFSKHDNLTTNLGANKPVVASFEYIQNHKQPSTILWKTLIYSLSGPIYPIALGNQQKKEFKYVGNNVSEVRTSGNSISWIPGGGIPYYAVEFIKYGNQKHFLKDLSDQLGFNPIDFTDIVSDNQPDLQVSLQSVEPILNIQLNWDNSIKYVVEQDDKFRPTSIKLDLYEKYLYPYSGINFLWSTMYKIKY